MKKTSLTAALAMALVGGFGTLTGNGGPSYYRTRRAPRPAWVAAELMADAQAKRDRKNAKRAALAVRP